MGDSCRPVRHPAGQPIGSSSLCAPFFSTAISTTTPSGDVLRGMRPPGIDGFTSRLARHGVLSMQQLNSGLKRSPCFFASMPGAQRASSGVLFLCVRSNRIRLLTSRMLVPGHSHTSQPLGPLVWKIPQTFDRHRTWQIGAPCRRRSRNAATSRQYWCLAASLTSSRLGIHERRFHHQSPWISCAAMLSRGISIGIDMATDLSGQ